MDMFLNKMNKKGYSQFIGVILVILIGYIILFVILPEFTPPAELRINLQTNQIVKNQNGVLFYKIASNKDIPLENVTVINFIVEYESSTKEIKSIGRMVRGVEYTDKYVFKTNNLSPGKYTIKTELYYTYNNESKKEELTLNFEVF